MSRKLTLTEILRDISITKDELKECINTDSDNIMQYSYLIHNQFVDIRTNAQVEGYQYSWQTIKGQQGLNPPSKDTGTKVEVPEIEMSWDETYEGLIDIMEDVLNARLSIKSELGLSTDLFEEYPYQITQSKSDTYDEYYVIGVEEAAKEIVLPSPDIDYDMLNHTITLSTTVSGGTIMYSINGSSYSAYNAPIQLYPSDNIVDIAAYVSLMLEGVEFNSDTIEERIYYKPTAFVENNMVAKYGMRRFTTEKYYGGTFLYDDLTYNSTYSTYMENDWWWVYNRYTTYIDINDPGPDDTVWSYITYVLTPDDLYKMAKGVCIPTTDGTYNWHPNSRVWNIPSGYIGYTWAGVRYPWGQEYIPEPDIINGYAYSYSSYDAYIDEEWLTIISPVKTAYMPLSDEIVQSNLRVKFLSYQNGYFILPGDSYSYGIPTIIDGTYMRDYFLDHTSDEPGHIDLGKIFYTPLNAYTSGGQRWSMKNGSWPKGPDGKQFVINASRLENYIQRDGRLFVGLSSQSLEDIEEKRSYTWTIPGTYFNDYKAREVTFTPFTYNMRTGEYS